MSKAYIKGHEQKGHEIQITLLDAGSWNGGAKLGIRTNAEEGQLKKKVPELAMPWKYVLRVGEMLTIVIEE